MSTHTHDRHERHDRHDGPDRADRYGAARPSVGEVLRPILLRGVLPGLLVFALLIAVGKIIMEPLDEIPSEEVIARWFVSGRTSVLNSVSHVFSTANDTWWTIGLAVVYAIIVLIATRKWWLSIVPLLAITLESSIFVAATHLVNRPRPGVAHLDPAPPTSSFPSGHTAASFALYWSLMLIASRIPNLALRRVIQTLCFVFPFLVGWARLYRGMHHLSDVLFGLALGIWCAFTAVACIRAAERHAAERDAAPGRAPLSR